MSKPNDDYEIDLMQILYILWHRLWIILLAAVVAGGAAFSVATFVITPLYEAEALMYVNNSSISLGSASVSISPSELTAAQSLVDTYIVILNTRTTLNEVIEKAGLGYSYDSFVGDNYPNVNYNTGTTNNRQALRTGRDEPYGIRRAYIRFALPSSFTSYHVASVYLRLKCKSSDGTQNVYAYRVTQSWDSNTITWNNKAAYSATSGAAHRSDKAVQDSDGWWKMECRTMLKNWKKGTPNYGFCVKDANESNTNIWATWYSSDAPSPNKPELIINLKGVICWRPAVGNTNAVLAWTSTPTAGCYSYEGLSNSTFSAMLNNSCNAWTAGGFSVLGGQSVSSAKIRAYYGNGTTLIEEQNFPIAPMNNENIHGYTKVSNSPTGETFNYNEVTRYVYEYVLAEIAVKPGAANKEQTLRHELGHGLGWIGHTDNDSDVMWHSSHSFLTDLTYRDTSQIVQVKP